MRKVKKKEKREKRNFIHQNQSLILLTTTNPHSLHSLSLCLYVCVDCCVCGRCQPTKKKKNNNNIPFPVHTCVCVGGFSSSYRRGVCGGGQWLQMHNHFQQHQLILTLFPESCFIFPLWYLWTIYLPFKHIQL
jgi:hypothetical protein